MKVKLADQASVQEGTLTEVDFFGRPAVLFRQDGRVTGYLNVCSHLGGPLALEGETLRCQWHGACFAARSGRAVCGPARPDSRLIRLPLKEEDDAVVYIYGE
jgi:nitrite reductase/ring-hydroxylating ferredoxin subunit